MPGDGRAQTRVGRGGWCPERRGRILTGVKSYELEISESLLDGVAVVVLAGELDLTNAAEVERRLEQAATDRGIVVDLNGVTFLDSAALHMLFRVARRPGPPLGIVLEPTALVARTLRIVGLHEVAAIRPTVEELAAEPTS
jgi:anti-anti-sigma factor